MTSLPPMGAGPNFPNLTWTARQAEAVAASLERAVVQLQRASRDIDGELPAGRE